MQSIFFGKQYLNKLKLYLLYLISENTNIVWCKLYSYKNFLSGDITKIQFEDLTNHTFWHVFFVMPMRESGIFATLYLQMVNVIFTIIISLFPFWWLSCNKLSFLNRPLFCHSQCVSHRHRQPNEPVPLVATWLCVCVCVCVCTRGAYFACRSVCVCLCRSCVCLCLCLLYVCLCLCLCHGLCLCQCLCLHLCQPY